MSEQNENDKSMQTNNSANRNMTFSEEECEQDSQPVCLISSGGDTVDAKGFFDVFKGASRPPPVGQLTTQVESLLYNMKHPKRRKCIIFNNKNFDAATRLNERRGTEIDGKALYGCFRSLDFDTTLYPDLCAKDIMSVMNKVSKEDHTKEDCLVVCILSHGEQGVLWARDEKYPIDAAFGFFKGDKCPTLAGKPKMFFIQACQGDFLDCGVPIYNAPDVTDSGTSMYRIPNFADFLISYSTVSGYYSWRNTTQGSWFIQAFIQVMEKYANQNMDLMTMLTIVNRKVAYEFESNVPNDPDFDKKKQIPCITSMLTRLIYFPPKI